MLVEVAASLNAALGEVQNYRFIVLPEQALASFSALPVKTLGTTKNASLNAAYHWELSNLTARELTDFAQLIIDFLRMSPSTPLAQGVLPTLNLSRREVAQQIVDWDASGTSPLDLTSVIDSARKAVGANP